MSIAQKIKQKSIIVKILGALIVALGLGTFYLGSSISEDADKLLRLDEQVMP